MPGVYESLSRGIQAGYDLGARADEAAESKRRTRFQEARQTLSDARADEEFGLRQRADRRAEERAANEEQRTGVRQRLDLLGAATRSLQQRRGELIGLSTAAQTAGQPVDPALGKEFGGIEQNLSQLRQQGLDDFSRLATGQITLSDLPPARLYTSLATATNMKPEELPVVASGAKDVTAGLETSNQGLVVQGVNKLMAPQLRIGVGTPSPHGGTITRKEIIGLDPAIDASGRERPDYVIPRLRIYTDEVGPDGKELYYDAPLTQRRSGDPDDPVVAINMKQGMNWMGNLGALAEAAQHPEMAAKLAQGAKEASPVVDRYLEQLINLGKPKVERVNIPAGGRLALVQGGKEVGSIEGPAKPPTTRNVVDGDQVSTEQWDPKTQQWVPLGKPGPRFKAPAGGAAALDANVQSEDWSKLAEIYLDTGKAPPLATGRQGTAERAAFRKAVTDAAAQRGMSGADIVANRAEVAGLTKTQAELQKRTSAIELFSSKVEKDMKTFDSLLDKAGMDSPLLINKPINALRRQFSDSELAKLDLAARQVGVEYERLITGGTLSVAQLHVGAQEDAKKLINGDMPPKQARAIMDVMRQEMQNNRTAAHESLADIKKQISNRPSGSGPAPSPAPAAAGGAPKRIANDADYNALPSGALFIGPDGKQRRKP